LGTMGFAVPAAIGAKVGRPDKRVVAIDGDGCFQMTLQELATTKQHGIPVVFCVVNNGYLGMVRQWQELFYGGRFSEVELPPDLPDLVKLADAYGIPGLRASRVEELGPVLDKAFEITDESVLIDLRVDPTEKVFPMIPSGCSNDEIIESADEWWARQHRLPQASEPETD
ncbi:MAG: thiamine pyrophosphate-dependent enzyme, partial [Actinomycetota bacterium]|nr:thiamine pyrophosphate-dependent enzyme [Actinomycetota bacterium]